MRRPTIAAALTAILLLAACGNNDDTDDGTGGQGQELTDEQQAAQTVLLDYLHAAAEGDWGHAYELTAQEARSARDRDDWIATQDSREPLCTREQPTDVELLPSHEGRVTFRSTTWAGPRQEVRCYWHVTADDGPWRVVGPLDRDEVGAT